MILVDGKALAALMLKSLKDEIRELGVAPILKVFTCAPTFETKKFLNLKRRRAEEVGITIEFVEFGGDASTPEIITTIKSAHTFGSGIIVQLPFPSTLSVGEILKSVASTHDVDALQYDGRATHILPPVVGAIAEIAMRHEIDFNNKRVVVVGSGRLVGAPMSLYARRQGATVDIIHKDSEGSESLLNQADILVLGAGVPGLIKGSMIKSGVVIFDAGTSEEDGMLVGDADNSVALKASLLTPVPGGIGPITIAVLLRNLLEIIKLQSQ